MVEIYKKECIGKVSEKTINNELNTLSGIFTKAIEWGKVLVNPVSKIKRFRITERKRILERLEHALIISARKEEKAPHLKALIVFDLNPGLRKEELLQSNGQTLILKIENYISGPRSPSIVNHVILIWLEWMLLIHYRGKVNTYSVIRRGKDLRILDDHFNLQPQELELRIL